MATLTLPLARGKGTFHWNDPLRLDSHTTDKGTFHWDDPLRLYLQLTDAEKEVQQNAFEYTQEFLLPRVVEVTRRTCRTRHSNNDAFHIDAALMPPLGNALANAFLVAIHCFRGHEARTADRRLWSRKARA